MKALPSGLSCVKSEQIVNGIRSISTYAYLVLFCRERARATSGRALGTIQQRRLWSAQTPEDLEFLQDANLMNVSCQVHIGDAHFSRRWICSTSPHCQFQIRHSRMSWPLVTAR